MPAWIGGIAVVRHGQAERGDVHSIGEIDRATRTGERIGADDGGVAIRPSDVGGAIPPIDGRGFPVARAIGDVRGGAVGVPSEVRGLGRRLKQRGQGDDQRGGERGAGEQAAEQGIGAIQFHGGFNWRRDLQAGTAEAGGESSTARVILRRPGGFGTSWVIHTNPNQTTSGVKHMNGGRHIIGMRQEGQDGWRHVLEESNSANKRTTHW